MASSPPVRYRGTTRARKDWESGDWTANLKLPPLGIPPPSGGGGCQMLGSLEGKISGGSQKIIASRGIGDLVENAR